MKSPAAESTGSHRHLKVEKEEKLSTETETYIGKMFKRTDSLSNMNLFNHRVHT